MIPSQGDHESRATEAHSLFLLTFSHARGIGFYEVNGVLHVLDLIAAQDLCVDTAVASYIYTLTGLQLEAGLSFASKEELLGFANREYLRDKKNTYYAELFTRRMHLKRRAKMLRFLNDTKLRGIPISESLTPLLKKLCEPEVVVVVIQLARHLRLKNVQECLEREFEQILHFCNATIGPEKGI